MSTYVYLVCLDHEPPIINRDESTQHRHNTSEMDRLRDWIARREALVEALNRDELDLSEYYLRNTVWFLQQHPRCRYAARDEYGEWIDLGWGTPDQPDHHHEDEADCDVRCHGAGTPLIHFEPNPVGPDHDGPEFTIDLQAVTCEACKAGVVRAVRAQRPVERQTWVRPLRPSVPGDVVASVELHLDVDAAGRAYVHEAVLAQLFREAGWERTA